MRVLARLAAPPQPAGETPAPPGGIPDEGPSPVQIVAGDTLFFPVDVNAVLVPTTLGLSAAEQNALRAAGENETRAFIEAAGLGEALVYNQLVSRLMAIPGILDVALEMSPARRSRGEAQEHPARQARRAGRRRRDHRPGRRRCWSCSTCRCASR